MKRKRRSKSPLMSRTKHRSLREGEEGKEIKERCLPLKEGRKEKKSTTFIASERRTNGSLFKERRESWGKKKRMEFFSQSPLQENL